MDTETGIRYNLFAEVYISFHWTYAVHLFTMLYISLSYNLKSQIYLDSKRRVTKDFVNKLLIFCSIVSYFLKFWFRFFPLAQITFVVFLINQSKTMKRGLTRILRILNHIKEIVLMQIVFILLVSYLVFIFSFGNSPSPINRLQRQNQRCPGILQFQFQKFHLHCGLDAHFADGELFP